MTAKTTPTADEESVGIGAMPGIKPRDPLLRLHPDDIAAIVAHVLAPKEPS